MGSGMGLFGSGGARPEKTRFFSGLVVYLGRGWFFSGLEKGFFGSGRYFSGLEEMCSGLEAWKWFFKSGRYFSGLEEMCSGLEAQVEGTMDGIFRVWRRCVRGWRLGNGFSGLDGIFRVWRRCVWGWRLKSSGPHNFTPREVFPGLEKVCLGVECQGVHLKQKLFTGLGKVCLGVEQQVVWFKHVGTVEFCCYWCGVMIYRRRLFWC